MKTIEINDKKYNIPENYSEINFGMFEKVQILIENHPSFPTITHDLVISVINLLVEIEEETIKNLPKSVYIFLYNTIFFVFSLEDLEKIEFKTSVKLLNGETLYCSDDPNVLVKEYIDRDLVLSEFPDEKKISGMISIFLRKKGEEYNSEFLEERILLIKEQPATAIFPFIAFFLHKREVLRKSMLLYSAGLQIYRLKMEEMENFLEKSGDGRMSFINWRTKICKNLTNFLNGEFMNCSTYYHTLQTRILQTQIDYKSNNK